MTRLHGEAWKDDERDFAAWAGGQRHASNGKAQQDLSGEWWTAEHKTFTALPARVIKAFDQAALNFVANPMKEAFVFFTLHFGRGRKNRRFIALEVDIQQDDFETKSRDLQAASLDANVRHIANPKA